MFDISNELSTKKLLEKSRSFYFGVKWCLHRLENKRKNQIAKQSEFLWAALLFGPFRSKGEMNPIPAIKTIKRLYYYSVTVFDLYLSMIARCNSFLSLTFDMSWLSTVLILWWLHKANSIITGVNESPFSVSK